MPEQPPVDSPERDSEARIASALRDPLDRGALREAIRGYTDAMRDDHPVERIIIMLKRVLARSHAGTSYLRVTREPLTETDRVMTDAVRWCIERYFWDDKRSD